MVACRMTPAVVRRKRTKVEKRINWWKLKKEDCCEEFREAWRQDLCGGEQPPDD